MNGATFSWLPFAAALAVAVVSSSMIITGTLWAARRACERNIARERRVWLLAVLAELNLDRHEAAQMRAPQRSSPSSAARSIKRLRIWRTCHRRSSWQSSVPPCLSAAATRRNRETSRCSMMLLSRSTWPHQPLPAICAVQPTRRLNPCLKTRYEIGDCASVLSDGDWSAARYGIAATGSIPPH